MAKRQNLEKTSQKLSVVPDSNVLIHGESLHLLPWEQLQRTSVEVVIVAPVIRELDKLKNHQGRVGKVARKLSGDIRTLMKLPHRQDELRKQKPAVSRRLDLRSFSEPMNPTLSLDHADQALINHVLTLRAEGLDVMLLTDDTICFATAESLGLAAMLLPDDWSRDVEPDDTAKEKVRLVAEIDRLKAAEPKVELSFFDDVGNDVEKLEVDLPFWPPLTPSQIDELMVQVDRVCPPAVSFERLKPKGTEVGLGLREAMLKYPALGGFSSKRYEPATSEEIDAYKSNAYPQWLEEIRAALGSIHNRLQANGPWPRLVAFARNTGTRPANKVLLRLNVQGDVTILNIEPDEDDDDISPKSERPLTLPLPPIPPRGHIKTTNPFDINPSLWDGVLGVTREAPHLVSPFRPPKPRDADAFYWRRGRRERVDIMELECEVWRHAHEDISIDFEIRPDQLVATTGIVELSVNVSNLSKPPKKTLPVRFGFVEESTLVRSRELIGQLGHRALQHERL